MSIKDFLGQIPNSVSGDGKTFVALLKKFLVQFESVTDEKLSNMSVGGAEQLIGAIANRNAFCGRKRYAAE